MECNKSQCTFINAYKYGAMYNIGPGPLQLNEHAQE